MSSNLKPTQFRQSLWSSSNKNFLHGGLRTRGVFKAHTAENPLITIITIVFNGEKYIEQTIKSVLNQDYANIEYIIVDGGSTDRTLEIIQKYEQDIDYWISEKDNGIADAFNKGISLARGYLVGLLNADDFYTSSKSISYIIDSLEQVENKNFYIHGVTHRISVSGELSIKESNKLSWAISVPFSHCSSFISLSSYENVGVYDSRYKIAMDVDLLFRVRAVSQEIMVDKPIATQRDGGISDKSRLLGYKEYYEIAKTHLGPLKSYLSYLLKLIIYVKNKAHENIRIL